MNVKFFFSAAVTFRSYEYLRKMPNYVPLNMLHTQYERKHIEHAMPYIDSGEFGKLFIDSGAYSVHTGKQKENIEEYVDYLNKIDDYTEVVAQFDQIPGKYHVPKMPEDYVYSAEKTWDNFLWMYNGLKSPQKLAWVFHQGEHPDNLKRSLEWKDKDGNGVGIIGLSGQGDSSEKMIRTWVTEMMQVVRNSKRPRTKVHLFGMASEVTIGRAVDLLETVGMEVISDSTTHVQLGAFGKILTPIFHQPVIVSGRQMPMNPESVKLLKDAGLDIEDKKFDFDSEDVKIALNGKSLYLEMLPYKGGDEMYDRLKKYIESLNITIEELQTTSYVRTAVNMYYLQHVFDKITQAQESKVLTSRKLF